MNVEDAIKGRRSIRSFKETPVSNESIRKIIEAGTYAPSGKNGQPWRFTVLTGSAKDELTELMNRELQSKASKYGAPAMGSSLSTCLIMKQAPVLIPVWNNRETFNQPRLVDMMAKLRMILPSADELLHTVEIQGVSAAIQNMLLVAYSMGLGTLWINDIYFALDALTTRFDNSWDLVAAVSLGYPADSEVSKSPPPKLSVDEVADFR
jgi:nitroreductase